MSLVPRDLEFSLRRAPCRDVVLIFLGVAGEASIEEIVRATGIRAARVVGIMEGRCCEYAEDLSLCAQGVARRVDGRDARRYRITRFGMRAAAEAWDRLG